MCHIQSLLSKTCHNSLVSEQMNCSVHVAPRICRSFALWPEVFHSIALCFHRTWKVCNHHVCQTNKSSLSMHVLKTFAKLDAGTNCCMCHEQAEEKNKYLPRVASARGSQRLMIECKTARLSLDLSSCEQPSFSTTGTAD